MNDQISSQATNAKARTPWAYGVGGTVLGLLAGGLICAWVLDDRGLQTKATGGEAVASVKNQVRSDSSQPMCCYVDASKSATATSAEGCFARYTGQACEAWIQWRNLQAEEEHAEAVAQFEYRRIRWPEPHVGDRSPSLKRYEVLMLPSVWCYRYVCPTWKAENGGPYSGAGDLSCKATREACESQRADNGSCNPTTPCSETKDVGVRVSSLESFVDKDAHETKMLEIRANSEAKLRQARWHRCRDQAEDAMDKDLELNCRLNVKKHTYSCPASFLQHEKDLRQRAYDACDRACPTCLLDD